jgi:ribosomal protein S4
MFRPHMASVVPMDHRKLASSDGSEEASGRGSGLVKAQQYTHTGQAIPYTNMVYAPLERRLDTAVFRALFASSARQARQFVIRGSVKVNGKKVWHLSNA